MSETKCDMVHRNRAERKASFKSFIFVLHFLPSTGCPEQLDGKLKKKSNNNAYKKCNWPPICRKPS